MKLALAALAAMFLATPVQAQQYPNRVVRILVPWPPGQAVDLVARAVAEKLTVSFGQPFIVENKPGAGGALGTETVVKSRPDGYTLLAGSTGPISINPVLQKLPYSPVNDLAPISLAGISPFVLVANPNLPVKTAAELIEFIRKAPGRHSFSSSGNGSTAHLTSELFNITAGLVASHVPYRGSAAALVDVVGGEISYTFESLATIAPFAKNGKLRPLAVSFDRRSPALPSVPTVAEAASMPGFNTYAWIGFLAPAGTPAEIVDRLGTEIRKAVAARDMVERLSLLGIEARSSSPDAMLGLMRDELDRYGSIIRRANIKLE